MSLRERYQNHSRKRNSHYLKLFFLLMITFGYVFTLARYTSSWSVSTATQVARWSISVNNVTVNNSTGTINNGVKICSVANGTYELSAGEVGYFDITINPNNTEVSVEYKLLFDVSNLPAGTTITSGEMFVGSPEVGPQNVTISTDSTTGKKCITGTVSLNGQALTTSDIRRYRIYCQLDSNASIDENEDYYVTIAVEGKQVI